ncbi:hypothetical protein P344_00810 [Spiroplasma mirum ATCC 29335]|uniref:Uncharacterized protein n=1 Tax=Spiroplasma mirum ATCC 29335 TaxID=838561 RepID=W6ALF8_9MOLU|nr:hypothetical protein [Spiroplasma mirum]AHI57535.1 hypothetical protein P344_00810 [Spiroplasma mirum ATCC 29335]
MKENKLYTYIAYALYNTFKDDNIKAQIIVNSEFKALVIKQICSLLTLEKEFDASFNDEKYTVAFAQALANVTNESATIEKIDGTTFNQLDEDYVEYIKYICDNFKVKKDYITQENVVTIDAIDKIADFVDEKAIDNARDQMNKKAAKGLEKEQQQDSAQSTGPMMGTGMGMNAFDPSKLDMGQMMQQMANMPIHPRLDPRFYPYRTKPKFMPLFKKIVAGLVILAAVGLIILWLLGSFLGIIIDTNVIVYKWNGSVIIVGGGADAGIHVGNNNFVGPFPFSSKLKLALTGAGSMSLFSGLLPIIPAIFMGYELLGAKRFKRDNYTVKMLTVGISVIILLYSSLSLISILLHNYVSNIVNGLGVPKSGINVGDSSLFGGILTPDSDLQQTLNNIINEINNSSSYKLIYAFSIIFMIVGLVASIATIALMIVAPKLDRNKLVRANEEYQKAVNAAMHGKKYIIDPSLFDEEFREDNPFNSFGNKDENKNNNQDDEDN